MITYFKNKNSKSKKKYKKYKTLTTIIKSFDTFAKTSSFITFSLTVIGLIAIPTSTALACGSSSDNKGIYEFFINKYNECKIQYGKDQITTKFSDKLYRKSLQENEIEKIDFGRLSKYFTKDVDERKKNPVHKDEYKSIFRLF